jgi:glutathione S-transferase
MTKVAIIGSYVSPYVRKVLVCLRLKGVAYEIDPIVPFMGDEAFSRLSPLRRVPVYVDAQVAIPDSSVICQYLEDRHPSPALYPADVALRARARWFEEYADSRLGDVLIWKLFYPVAILPYVFNKPRDKARIERTLSEDVPQVLDYLESELPAAGFVCGELSIADVSIACFFRTAAFARFTPDAARYPKTAAYIARVLALPAFSELAMFEDALIRTPVAQHRSTLAALGAPLTQSTYGTDHPRAGFFEY